MSELDRAVKLTQKNPTAGKRTAIESFCGAGGMALGLSRAGFDVRLAFDVVEAHVKTHNHNLGGHAKVLDASKVTGAELLRAANLQPGELDLFSGGPPCQGFSKQRRGASVFDDPRNRLVVHFARLTNEMRPKAFLFENVAIFGQKRGAKHIEEMEEMLSDYHVHCFQVCAADFGLPQTRERFMMIGLRRDVTNAAPVLEHASTQYSIKDIISDLPPPPDDYSEHPTYPNHQKCKITKLNEERFSHVPQGGGWQDIPWDLRLPCHRVTDVKKGGWPDVYGRLRWDGQSPTITVGFDSFTRGRFGHPEQHRAITPREAARIQGFPDSFRFLGTRMDVRTQIGNAVPPPLAEAAGRAIMRALEQLEADVKGTKAVRQLHQGKQPQLVF
ncbi:DNA cytosine methyltransferase [Pseudomonas aeruginosa]|uniref:DNA cytosine methyltransferase n=1 Tax=Pseudomonas aeruginosa TaxID=287 RepID=UPI0018A27A81|nr:DNA cytosine methyltransferase [Pseudomonas aeruginosa]HCF2525387.1 DNA cytosine methyltransferase [Pseudomonas aeruginosa]HDQ4058840.1 DNA cytosine methyltransferase [Pseudomonas aeruginosa]